MKKIWGSILFGLARFIDVLFGGLIQGLSILVNAIKQVRALFASFFTCLLFFIILNPFSLLLLNNRWILLLVIVLFIVPLLGSGFVSLLDYGKYVLTEYLYDQADYYRLGRESRKNFSSYGPSYFRKKRQAEEEEARKRQEAQQEEWDRIFQEFFRQNGGGYGDFGSGSSSNFNQGGFGDFGGFGGFGGSYYQQGPQGGYEGYRQQQQQYNPFSDFKSQYEKNCDVLGLSYDTDEYQVKLAYRKLAKKYHPDLNKSPDATKKFQEVNAAYEFLSKENIDRYKKMS